jgi:hypothetical protein
LWIDADAQRGARLLHSPPEPLQVAVHGGRSHIRCTSLACAGRVLCCAIGGAGRPGQTQPRSSAGMNQAGGELPSIWPSSVTGSSEATWKPEPLASVISRRSMPSGPTLR